MCRTAPQWCLPPDNLKLERNEVHVWRAWVNLSNVQIQFLKGVLSDLENRRSEAFFFQKDAERFIVARGVLRTILSRYVGGRPGQLRFTSGLFSKPNLIWEPGIEKVRFSLSHSHRLALYAIASEREVGVDVERIRADIADEQIAERLFSVNEAAKLRELPEAARKQAFFCCWTRKEAYAKAKGVGLSLSLDQFEVSLAPGESEVLLTVPGDPDEARRWSLRALHPALGYAAAVAVEGHSWNLRCWQWQPD